MKQKAVMIDLRDERVLRELFGRFYGGGPCAGGFSLYVAACACADGRNGF